jgi:soluble cytochrome b562
MEEIKMSNHKNKEEAFWAVESGVKEASDQLEVVKSVLNEAALGKELSHLKNEVSEANQQIQKALEVCSDTQHERIKEFQVKINKITEEMDSFEKLI